MPLIRDKILTNSGEIRGNNAISSGNDAAIQEAYTSALTLAHEIEQNGWLKEKEALDFLARQEALCTQYEDDYLNHHKHQLSHLRSMNELVNDMRVWIDKQLLAKP